MIRIQQWVKLLQMANESGLSRRDWCKENDISENAFYYWQRKLRRLALGQAVNDSTAFLSQTSDPDQRQDFFEITVPEPVSSAPFCGQTGRSVHPAAPAGRKTSVGQNCSHDTRKPGAPQGQYHMAPFFSSFRSNYYVESHLPSGNRPILQRWSGWKIRKAEQNCIWQ